MQIDDRQFDAMRAMVAYIYNTNGNQFAKDIFPGRHPDYMAEYADAWAATPTRGIGKLDKDNKRKLFGIALDRYGVSEVSR